MVKPIKDQIKGIIRFVIDDFKRDLTFIGGLFEGNIKLKINKNKLKELLDLEGFIKTNWLMFFLVAFAFVCGIFYGSQYYQDKCNLFIQEEVLPQCNIAFSDDFVNNITNGVINTESPNKKWLDDINSKLETG